MSEWPECEEFYNLMQTYRHAKLVEPDRTVDAYNAAKKWLVNQLASTRVSAAGAQRESDALKAGVLSHELRDIIRANPLTTDEGKWLEEYVAGKVAEARLEEARQWHKWGM